MTQTAALAPADRFALIIEGLCQAVAQRCGPRISRGGLAGPLIILVWSRLRRLATRFARHAISLPAPSRPRAPRLASSPHRSQPLLLPRPSLPRPSLPRNRAWLLRLAPETASGASQLRHFLADPEVAALLAAAPHLHRILRPLCHMLGIRPAQTLPPPSPPPAAAPSCRPIPCHAPPQAETLAVLPQAPPPRSPCAAPNALT